MNFLEKQTKEGAGIQKVWNTCESDPRNRIPYAENPNSKEWR
jgi:hypothetical protein